MAGNRITAGLATADALGGHQFAIIVGDQWAMLLPSQDRVASASPAPSPVLAGGRPLTEADAIDIWIARWLRIRRKDLLARYGCDPRRLYDIWEEHRFIGSRAKAAELFTERHPGLIDRIDFGPHRRIPRRPPSDLQPGLFDEEPAPPLPAAT
jgi:hypothetical protein